MPNRPPNPKVRITGAVLCVLGVLSLVGAVTGWDADSGGGRVALAVTAAVLLLLGISLLAARTPGLRAVRADPAGLHVELVDGRTATVPWPAVRTIRLTRPSPVLGGAMLTLHYAGADGHSPELASFERQGRVLLGLPDRRAAETLRAQLPTAAGARYQP